MPDYVYGLHDFEPENPDEVPFKVGERVEVLEKDDLYQDGWWTVSCNIHIFLDTPAIPSEHLFLRTGPT